jgi:glucose-1-phosphatase
MTIRVVVFDLDGVVRHWDAELNASIEQRHGLAPNSILDTAFAPDLGVAAVTGALDYDTWAARVAERLGSPAAVAEWGEFRGHVDPDAVALVEAVRTGGCRVGLLSNATTRLEEDLAHLGLDGAFDLVFNTARLGICKPDPEVY